MLTRRIYRIRYDVGREDSMIPLPLMDDEGTVECGLLAYLTLPYVRERTDTCGLVRIVTSTCLCV